MIYEIVSLSATFMLGIGVGFVIGYVKGSDNTHEGSFYEEGENNAT